MAYRYRAFGEQTVLSGSSPNRFTWVGRSGYYRQPDLGNYWLRARIYEDGIGRFLSRDPAQDEINLYRYVANRPLVLVDPAGLQGLPGGQGGMLWKRGDRQVAAACQPGWLPGWKPVDCLPIMGMVTGWPPCDACAERRAIERRITQEVQPYLALLRQGQYLPPGTVTLVCIGCMCRRKPIRVGRRVSYQYYRRYMIIIVPREFRRYSGCVRQCLLQHEMVHADQCLATPYMNYFQSEIDAYERELECLQNLLATPCWGAGSQAPGDATRAWHVQEGTSAAMASGLAVPRAPGLWEGQEHCPGGERLGIPENAG